MVDENEVVVSQSDIDNVTRDLLQKDKANEDKIRAEERIKVKKEMEDEAATQKLLNDKKMLEAALVQKDKENVAEIATLKAEQEKLKEQIGQGKGIVDTKNPFSQGKENNEQELDLDKLTPEQINEIDEASKDAWKETIIGKKGTTTRDFRNW